MKNVEMKNLLPLPGIEPWMTCPQPKAILTECISEILNAGISSEGI
jgi:hypothetical protein